MHYAEIHQNGRNKNLKSLLEDSDVNNGNDDKNVNIFFSQNCFMYSNINLVNLYFIWNF